MQSASVAPSWAATGVGVYKWNLGTLTVGQTGQIIITSRYIGDRTNGEALTNVAIISTSSTGDLVSNNS